ncbi:MAG: helix-turn-helix domain-containing protein [Gammaproteobacteria bacterium]|nr:helix-turn-helix domain-containing protein [Gammaproteobacteria bacterium]
MDLIETLRSPEGKTLEFKQDLSSPAGFKRTVVAFANTAGGTILIGVEDKSGYVRGVADPLALEERVASVISDSISPRVLPDIELLSYRDTQVLAVQIYPSASRPHYLAASGLEAGTYVRVGSTNRPADAELIAEMQRFSRGEAYDEQPMPDLNSEAVDFRVASESFAEVRKLRRRDLETLRLVTNHQGHKVPTVGGMLLFGQERRAYFPDAWIQAGRFEGKDKAKIFDHADLKMPLVPAIDQAVAFVEKHALRGADISRLRREERWNLPPAAVREAIVNAVAHADYAQRGAPIRLAIFDDRLEIENPGLLPFGLTVDDLPHGVSKLRNRVIGRILHELGLVEQWGSGAQRMIAACKDSGLAPPVWEEVGTRLRVTLYMEKIGPATIDPIDQAILDVLGSAEGCGTSEVAEKIERSPRATRTRLAKLVSRGLVREIGTGPKDPKRRYYRST